MWISRTLTLAASGTTAPTADIVYDLSDYLPKDNCLYEMIVCGRAASGATSGNSVLVSVNGGAVGTQYVCQGHTAAATSISSRGNALVPIGADKKLTLVGVTTNVGTFGLYLEGYRRIGGNY